MKDRNFATKDIGSDSIVLGLFLSSHLGDALCSTTLPRKISQHLHKKVYIVHHKSTYCVFKNNPYVKDFRNDKRITLRNRLKGHGHFIQKLERGFGLPIDHIPKPEIYLSEEELRWAFAERQKWPQQKPICILNTGCITDEGFESYTNLAWQQIVGVLENHFTVVHPVITSIEYYNSQFAVSNEIQQNWQPDVPINSVIIYQNLPTRLYMSLFTVSDFYCGPASGGSHVAAALGLSALIILNHRVKQEKLVFPTPNPGFTVESFLYPQHTFVRSDELYPSSFDFKRFSSLIEHPINTTNRNDNKI